MKTTDIFRTLRPINVTRIYMYSPLKFFGDIGRVTDRPKFCHQRDVRTLKAVKVVQNEIRRNLKLIPRVQRGHHPASVMV